MSDIKKYKFRKAKISDGKELEKLISLSSTLVNRKYYSKDIINAAIGNIWAVDEQLILDETYWVVENQNKEIIGCGGWSKRKLLFGSSKTINNKNDELTVGVDPAKIRAFFVHPDYIRRGIGNELLKICEGQAKLVGFTSLELIATLSGEKLYKARGFLENRRIDVDLGNGIVGEAVEMSKVLN